MSRRILVVSYYHPPFPGSGGNRWVAMARYLRRAGHEVTILASDAFGALPDDAAQAVVRVRDLKSAAALRRLLGRGELRAAGSGPVVEAPAPALLTKVLVPDALAVSWGPAAALAARRLISAGGVDCLVTTSPPDSAHLVGLALGRRRPAWLADFRDGWGFEPLREPFPTRPQRSLDRRMERRVARSAEFAVGATRPIAHDLENRLGAHAGWVPNGWDPEAAPPPAPVRAAEGTVTLVHTGTLSGGWGRDPAPLLAALRSVADEPGAPPLRLVLAGGVTEQEQNLIAGLGLQDVVRRVGVLPRVGALALQRSADALVLLTSRNASEATGKVYEYLAAGRPIIALAEGNEAARIVQATGTGVTVAPDDREAIAGALRRLLSGDLQSAYAPHDLERFFYPGPAEAMAGFIEEAVARRATACS